MIRQLLHLIGAALGSAHRRRLVVDDCASIVATRRGDYEACDERAKFYAQRAARIDPQLEWHEFARVKQKWSDAVDDRYVASQRYDAARLALAKSLDKLEPQQ